MKIPLDVLLVTPPSKDRVFQELGKSLAAIEPPVWSTLMATFFQRHGHSVRILDAEAEGLAYDETARSILDTGAVLTVFVVYGHQPSASTQCMPAGRAVCQRVVEGDSNLKTFLSGNKTFRTI